MTPPIFNLDDEVKTTNGTRFKISQIWKKPNGSLAYSGVNRRWVPAGDLRLVEEELKIGDWAEIVGPDYRGSGEEQCERFKIESIDQERDWISACGMNFYPASSLRKLTPEEVQAHLNPGKPTYEYPITPAKDFDDLTLRDIARMSGICKNEHGVWISTLLKRVHDVESRITFVEKIQRDQDDLMGRAIRDGVVEIQDFRRKA